MILNPESSPLSRNIEDYPEGIVIPIDKPYRWTSADVIRKVKFAAIRHFGKKNLKVGHAGTLDPLATGVLLVCIGKATKLAETLQSHDKEYVAGITFGATTPSYDLEKEIDRFFPHEHITEDSVREALPAFIGEQDQIAPLFSAKSVDGVRAYELARKLHKEGKTLDEAAEELIRVSRISITELELLKYQGFSGDAGLENDPSHFVGPSPCGQGGSTVLKTAPADSKCIHQDELKAEYFDAEGGFVMPAFCDSHTHIVYAGCRDGEFRDKIAGLSYEEIAARGGGILNSADLLHETSEDELYEQSMVRVREIMEMGTGAVEIKSGYGLTVEDELKMLRVIRRIKETAPITVKANFLGAHAVGRAYRGRQSEYVDLVCNEMLPRVAEEGLADYVDVFCDEGFFTVEETDRILSVAAGYGITPKIHANELEVSGGVQVGVKHGALSVDHLEKTTDAEIEALRGSVTMPTMLPGCSFFLGIPFGRAKDYIEAGLPVALASDYNPGSSPSGNMRFVMALGCIRMRLTPEQSFNACTINTAYAMGVSDTLGSITVGKKANLIITKPVPSLAFIPYSHQTPIIRQVLLNGAAV